MWRSVLWYFALLPIAPGLVTYAGCLLLAGAVVSALFVLSVPG